MFESVPLLRSALFFSFCALSASYGQAQYIQNPSSSAPAEISQETQIEPMAQFMANLPHKPFASLKYIIEKLNNSQMTTLNGDRIKVTLSTLAPNNPSQSLYDFQPLFGDRSFNINIALRPDLENNPFYMLEVMTHLSYIVADANTFQVAIKSSDEVSSRRVSVFSALSVSSPGFPYAMMPPMRWAELSLNKSLGSDYAKRDWLQLEMSIIKSVHESSRSFVFIKDRPEEELKKHIIALVQARKQKVDVTSSFNDLSEAYYLSLQTSLQKDFVAQQSLVKSRYKKERLVLGDEASKNRKAKLESQDQKLNDFVKANDREGVARLLEVYLPLEIMEPLEQNMWKEWIEAIRRPLESKKVLIFRGLDEGDKPQEVVDAKGKVTGAGYFSTLLNRNQGSYTRRLRSLTTMRYRLMNMFNSKKSPMEVTPSLLDMMRNHSQDPVGSPLLSFSSSPEVAQRFAISNGSTTKMVAVMVDARRVLPNIVTTTRPELEILLPLVIFPDEIVLSEVNGSDMKAYEAKLNQKLGYDYRTKLLPQSVELFQKTYTDFSKISNTCSAVF